MWSPVEQTALAEAEVEYADRKATQIYVKFPVVTMPAKYQNLIQKNINEVYEGKRSFPTKNAEETLADLKLLDNASVVIWTTTPWTIPANRAVSFSNKIKYGLYEVTEMEESEFEPWSKPGDKLIVADNLWKIVSKAGLIKSANRLDDIEPDGLVLSHPLKNMEGSDGKYDFRVPPRHR